MAEEINIGVISSTNLDMYKSNALGFVFTQVENTPYANSQGVLKVWAITKKIGTPRYIQMFFGDNGSMWIRYGYGGVWFSWRQVG